MVQVTVAVLASMRSGEPRTPNPLVKRLKNYM
jgi:hypothetical protein